ncbi:isochorismatase family protein [Pseudofulvibacter geojedonensis]|uniref:Isochorismatase family protein n=1 Tax=Pseudofulvibacter geojedonensis TaxID=1123758 RepID=A0ABW3I0J4_9FLAO
MKKALLIIDMQKGSFTSKTPRHDSENIIKRINPLSEEFCKQGLPVIFIQHDGTKENEFIPNTTEWEILNSLNIPLNSFFVQKYANDIFYQSKLKEVLDNLNITELFITGCATDFCVESSIQSAITKDYDLTIIADAHTTGNRPHIRASKIIEHYNWVWQNMIPTKGKVQVIKTLDFIS